MKTLFLFRHAKSSWDEPLDDFDRPLASRGRRAAPAMAEHMAARGLVPSRVLCSPAARTRETWGLMAPILGPDVPVEYHRELYESSASRVLDVIRDAEGTGSTLMVVGHNPSLQQLAQRLAAGGDRKLLDRLNGKFPTAALAVLELDVEEWSEVGRGGGTLVRLDRPKGLPGAGDRGL